MGVVGRDTRKGRREGGGRERTYRQGKIGSSGARAIDKRLCGGFTDAVGAALGPKLCVSGGKAGRMGKEVLEG